MAEPRPIKLSFAALLGWVFFSGVPAGAIGIYPAHHFYGSDGMIAGAISFLAVLAAMLITASFVIAQGPKGSARIAMTFMAMSMVRMFLCIGLLAVICMNIEIEETVIIIWAGWLYMAMLAGECIWLVRGLRSNS